MTDSPPDRAPGVPAKEAVHGELPTIAAIAVIAYALANLLHEGLGHGGACVLMAGQPHVLTSVHFGGEVQGEWPARFMQAGGTLANLLAGGLAFFALRSLRHGSGAAAPRPNAQRPALNPHLAYFLWLFMTVNLLQGTGYWLFSGIAGIADWAGVIRGWEPHWLWRLGLAILGGASYFASVRLSLRELGPFIGGVTPSRVGRAKRLMLVPYFTGALLFIASGFLNPVGPVLVALSAAPASLGGTSGLAWGAQLLRDPNFARSSTGPAPIPLHWGWIAAAVVTAAVFVFVLGPGVRLG